MALGRARARLRGRPRALLGGAGRLRRDPQLHPPEVLERPVLPADRVRPARLGLLPGARAQLRDRLPGRAVGAPAPVARRRLPRPAELGPGLPRGGPDRRLPRPPGAPAAGPGHPLARAPRLPLQLRLPEHDGLALPRHEAARRPAAPGPAAARGGRAPPAPARAARGLRGRLRHGPRHEPARPPGSLLRARARGLSRPGLDPHAPRALARAGRLRGGRRLGRLQLRARPLDHPRPQRLLARVPLPAAAPGPTACSRTPGSRPSSSWATGRPCSWAASRRRCSPPPRWRPAPPGRGMPVTSGGSSPSASASRSPPWPGRWRWWRSWCSGTSR